MALEGRSIQTIAEVLKLNAIWLPQVALIFVLVQKLPRLKRLEDETDSGRTRLPRPGHSHLRPYAVLACPYCPK